MKTFIQIISVTNIHRIVNNFQTKIKTPEPCDSGGGGIYRGLEVILLLYNSIVTYTC